MTPPSPPSERAVNGNPFALAEADEPLGPVAAVDRIEAMAGPLP